MKRYLPLGFLILCASCFLATVAIDFPQLPERVATHFDLSGSANGWMSRPDHMISMVCMGFGLPTFISVIMLLMRVLPSSTLNVPHSAYWRAPDNYPRACQFMLRASFWYGAGLMLWNALLSHSITKANQLTPPKLGNDQFIPIMLFFLGITAIWIVYLYRWFERNKP